MGRDFEELKYRLCDELLEYENKSRWTEKDVMNIYFLAHAKESLMQADNMEEEYSSNRSYRSYDRGGNNSYRRGRSYDRYYMMDTDDDRSHGRYYDDRNSYRDRGRSYDDGMEEMEDELEKMMNQATDAETKEAIKKTMAHMKKMNK